MRTHYQRLVVGALLALGTAAGVCSTSFAALTPYDVPVITCGDATLASITLNVCSPLGSSGAPAGLTIQWMTQADFKANGGWYDSDDPRLCKLSLSGQPSLQHPEKSRWELVPGECEDITIGDINFDETGVSGSNCGLDPLECATEYVFRWFAHAGRGFGRSDWGGELTCATLPCPPDGRCTYTQGYWKNHGGPVGCNQAPVNPPDPAWPNSVMVGGMMLGSPAQAYTASQLCTILNTSGGQHKALLTMAHQLIAANLNLANGAQGCQALTDAIALGNSQIGNVNLYALATGSCPGNGPWALAGCGNTVPSANGPLTLFNEGVLGGLCGPHCSVGPPVPQMRSGEAQQDGSLAPLQSPQTTWGRIKVIYR